jgi:hypothetical protein
MTARINQEAYDELMRRANKGSEFDKHLQSMLSPTEPEPGKYIEDANWLRNMADVMAAIHTENAERLRKVADILDPKPANPHAELIERANAVLTGGEIVKCDIPSVGEAIYKRNQIIRELLTALEAIGEK